MSLLPQRPLRWKERPDSTIYKCPCDRCSHYLQKQQALKGNEKLLQKLRLSQFKLRYQYREYHFQLAQLAPAAPDRPTVDLTRIHRSSDVLGLVLAFHISFALSARKIAQVLHQVFGVSGERENARSTAQQEEDARNRDDEEYKAQQENQKPSRHPIAGSAAR